MDYTEIITSVIALLMAILTGIVIPVVKSKLSDDKYNTIKNIVTTGVYFVEQISKNDIFKAEDKFNGAYNYIVDQLQSKGINFDANEVRTLIEAEVGKLNFNKSK